MSSKCPLSGEHDKACNTRRAGPLNLRWASLLDLEASSMAIDCWVQTQKYTRCCLGVAGVVWGGVLQLPFPSDYVRARTARTSV